MGVIIDSTLSSKDHITRLTSKLNKAWYAIRAVKSLITLHILQMIFYSNFHSLLSYGIIFWGNKHFSDSIFKIQKRIIRVITNIDRRYKHRELNKKLRTLTLPSQYIFWLLVSVNKNGSCFLSNSEIHDVNTRYEHNLHLPSTNLTWVQNGVHFREAKYITT